MAAKPVASSGTARCVVAFAGMPASRMVAAMRFQPQSPENDVLTLVAAVEASVLSRAPPLRHRLIS